MKSLSRSLLLAPLVAALAAVSPPAADACAPVMSRGERVAIASESALIIYDERTQTEHFIRRGTFETNVPYFGFLVPTPSVPDVAEASDNLFPLMSDWTKPEIVIHNVKRPRDWRGSRATPGMAADSAPKEPGNVQVVGAGQVADFHYVILKADDAARLKDWLEKYGYATRPDLEAWLGSYIKQGWFITAFQMAKPEDRKQSTGLSSKAVRMSFKTDRPFYPYMEPASQREEGAFKPNRLLRVFYVGPQRVEGKLDDPKTPWPGEAVWSNTIDESRKQQLVDRLGGKDLAMPEKAWLTEFEDKSSPRPGTSDLFFAPAALQTAKARPPIYHTNYITDDSPLGVEPWKVVVVGGVGLLVFGTLGLLMFRSLTGRQKN